MIQDDLRETAAKFNILSDWLADELPSGPGKSEAIDYVRKAHDLAISSIRRSALPDDDPAE